MHFWVLVRKQDVRKHTFTMSHFTRLHFQTNGALIKA